MTNLLQQTQLEAVSDYLVDGKAITPLEALNLFGCMRLAAIIHILRKEGMPIKTERFGKAGYARYSLTAANDNTPRTIQTELVFS